MQILIAVLFLLFLPHLSDAQVIDRVVAVVNDDVITLSDLDEEGGPTFKKIRAITPPDKLVETLNEARKQILSLMIDKSLVAQRAEELHIGVSEEELENAHQGTLKANKISEAELFDKLQSSGRSEKEYRESLRIQLLHNKLIRTQISSKIVITDENIEEYYNNNYKDKPVPEGYHVLQIGFILENNVKDPMLRAELEGLAHKVRDMAVEGRNFKTLARTFSRMPSAADGGDLGVFQKDEMAGPMREAIFSIGPGGISPIIETASGFQFFKLLSIKDGTQIKQVPLDSIRGEIEEILIQEETETKYKDWLKEIRQTAYIQEML
ncbi:MAG: SurA N-terminal domain-containing protein [Proteobacteria bacterium]|nr:SurA N-terminal domain-containing protein [Pseudomonadota bacterium]MBU1710347.1 SurA N-terminal domain-containing protein [Pseudomonadota bacterium]